MIDFKKLIQIDWQKFENNAQMRPKSKTIQNPCHVLNIVRVMVVQMPEDFDFNSALFVEFRFVFNNLQSYDLWSLMI